MPNKRPTPEQIIGNLHEVEIALAQGIGTAKACRRITANMQTHYRWRKEFGGLKTDQACRMKDLEKENLQLRPTVSDLTLERFPPGLGRRGISTNALI